MKQNFNFSNDEIKLFKKLNTPAKIQDFINSLKINFEENGDTCQSPRMVLKSGKAHCMEGAILATAILRFHGYEPLIMDLEADKDDFDHSIAVFKKDGFLGAIGKTNHAVLRYREPIYKNPRELALSFFHEYFLNNNGKKTLRAYSKPINLKIFDKWNWMASESEVWFIPEYLAKIKHYPIINKKQLRNLRPADEIEIRAGKIVEFNELD
ncbi:MAG: hypothetical protein QW727_02670 [Candidatus Pacearchaeota archaeon]